MSSAKATKLMPAARREALLLSPDPMRVYTSVLRFVCDALPCNHLVGFLFDIRTLIDMET